jgi:hypothetical protein
VLAGCFLEVLGAREGGAGSKTNRDGRTAQADGEGASHRNEPQRCDAHEEFAVADLGV